MVDAVQTGFKTRILAAIIQDERPKTGQAERILVIGCGDGAEAGVIADYFGCHVDAIDIEDSYVARNDRVTFTKMDAMHLDFPGDYFDIVYSFHALEHIPSPETAIAEARRVLKPGGLFCIGTPNRSRLVAYLSSQDVDLSTKIRWNLCDLKQRLSGKFKNELGAHAGFTSRELMKLCSKIGPCIPVTGRYYQVLYSRFRSIIRILQITGLSRFLFPCCYVVGWGGPEPCAVREREPQGSARLSGQPGLAHSDQ
jgi:ubiquinone/menaquinone biosynthesis C-methylase UbiE